MSNIHEPTWTKVQEHLPINIYIYIHIYIYAYTHIYCAYMCNVIHICLSSSSHLQTPLGLSFRLVLGHKKKNDILLMSCGFHYVESKSPEDECAGQKRLLSLPFTHQTCSNTQLNTRLPLRRALGCPLVARRSRKSSNTLCCVPPFFLCPHPRSCTTQRTPHSRQLHCNFQSPHDYWCDSSCSHVWHL